MALPDVMKGSSGATVDGDGKAPPSQATDKKTRRELTPSQHAGWMPHDLAALEKFLHDHLHKRVRAKHGDKAHWAHPEELGGLELHRSVAELHKVLQDDPVARMLMHRAVDQAPRDLVENNTFINSVETLLLAIDAVLDHAPEYSGEGMVGVPICALLAILMGTPAGFEAFANVRINAAFKDILNEWCEFLDTPESRATLHTWLSPEAVADLGMDDYVWDPKDKYGGFKSWNDFFTRALRTNDPLPRPIASPDDSRVITSACDSHVSKIQRNTRLQTKFWVKTQPYSLADILGPELRDEYAEQFVGGDIYQAFLSAKKYHRWHSPVDGEVIASGLVEGTYYSSLDGAPVDPAPPDGSQAYLSHVAARAVFIIKAKDPVGLVAVVPVGMAEVSSNNIDEKFKVKRGDKPVPVKKGEQIGMFKYGGSTHLVIFQKGVIKEFSWCPGQDVKMGEQIALAN